MEIVHEQEELDDKINYYSTADCVDQRNNVIANECCG